MARNKPKQSSLKSETLSPRKRRVFQLISLAIPCLLVALTEFILRFWGFGGYPPMLQRVGQVDGGTLVIADQGAAVSWFFANPDRPGSNEQYTFLDPKPTDTIRIFLVGESAMQGYPQPRHLASSAFLQAMLQDAWPERKVEVINLGTTAVASYPVLGILTEALDYQPDLVVIYTGNNEFFGTYGVASIGRAGSKPWMLKANRQLRSLALVQAADKLLRSKTDFDRTLMENMLGQSYVGPTAWQRKAAANNLHLNVTEMITRCQARDIPVLVCTLPTNERDLAPIGEDRIETLAATTREEIESLLSKWQVAQRENPEAALGALRRILELHPNHARAHFLLGQTLATQGKHTEALDEFVKANDLDTMPWRAPTPSQQAILDAARELNAPVCDLVKHFREASRNGAIGWELMDDHVHPTLRGQALIAESIMESLSKFEGMLHLSAEARARVPAWENYAHRLGDNIYDRFGVAHNMRMLFNAPFLRRNNPDAFERFNGMASKIEYQLTPEVREAMREWEQTRPFAGARCPITAAVAQLLMKQDNYEEALELFQIAIRGVPQYTSWHLEYVYYALLCKQKLNGGLSEEDGRQAQAAIAQGHFLLQHSHAENGFTARYTGLLHLLRREYAEAVPLLLTSRQKLTGFDRLVVDQTLILSLLKTSQYERARALAAEGVANGGELAARYQALLEQLPALKAAADATSTTNRVLK